MRKLVVGFIFIILFLFIGICIMVGIDKSNINDMKDKISEDTKIENITYINKYDNYYIVKDKNYVYILDDSYNEIYNISLDKLCDKDYDLVYRDSKLLYMDDYSNEEGLIFKYYDAYTCEIIDYLMVGGSYG